MSVEVEINGSTAETARYVAHSPSPCRIRQVGGSADAAVTLRSRAALPGGGVLTFYALPDAQGRATLPLTLPANGDWVEFWMGGRFGYPSMEDKDCLLGVTGALSATIPLMVRVRKNANQLTTGERDRFLAAWAAVNNAGHGPFQDFRDMHVNAANAEEHGGPQFLPWHRTYLLDLERVMQSFDPSVSLHYWRFDEPAPELFRSDFLGATVQVSEGSPAEPVTFDATNPLSAWVVDGVSGVMRSSYFDTQTSAAPGPSGFPLLSQADTLALGSIYSLFRGMERSPHGAAHVSFAGSISVIATAPKDPLFFLLHSNVDRLWALWQWYNSRTNPDKTETYSGQNVDGRRLDDTTWPWNGVITPPRPDFAPRTALASTPVSSVPGNTPTIRSVIDFQGNTSNTARIGVGYDVVPFAPK